MTEDGTIALEQKNGVLVSNVLLQKLLVTIYSNILSSVAKSWYVVLHFIYSNLVQLLSFNQLQLICSMYFDPKGVREELLIKHHFLNAIFKALPLSENKKQERIETLKKTEDTSHPIEIRGISILYDKTSVVGLTYSSRKELLKKWAETKKKSIRTRLVMTPTMKKNVKKKKAERPRKVTFT